MAKIHEAGNVNIDGCGKKREEEGGGKERSCDCFALLCFALLCCSLPSTRICALT
jgi:hypothetical protein